MPIGADAVSLIRFFFPYLRRIRRRWLQAACLSLIGPLFAAALLWSVKLLVDEVFVAGRLDLLPLFTGIYVTVVAIKLMAEYADTRLDAAITEQIAVDVRVDLYRHLLGLSPGSLRNHSIGDQLTRLSGDVERIEFLIYTGLVGLITDAFAAILFVSFLLVLSWKLTLCALIVAPILALTSLRYAPRIRRAARVARRGVVRWTSLAEERLGATTAIHAYGTSVVETGEFERRCVAARAAELLAVSVQAGAALLIEIVAGVGGLTVILVGALEIHNGSLTVGTLVAFLGSVGSLYGPIHGLAKAPGRFERASARAQRVQEMLTTPSAVADSPRARPLPRPAGRLEFESVSFGYERGRPVLHDVTLAVEPGETVALVGASGSGKSSLVKLALRLHDPWSGCVRVDGHDIREITLELLRRAVAVIFQDPYVLRGSIADNMTYGQFGSSEEQLDAAARAARVEPFAMALRGGYRAPVGPGGAWLSGGQRQRVAFARAFMRDAPVLLLDEATASVDSETEDLIHDAMDRLMGRRTLLIVGHRLSSIRRADRVVVIENGRIVEAGTPLSLLRRGTRYRQLFAGQLAAEEAAA